jgi:tripartite-type tricarboxylate transporter receptor subunit TctC
LQTVAQREPSFERLAHSIAAVLVTACSAAALAQNFPAKPIHAIIPFSPGGAVDVPARALGPRLQEIWGKPVVLDNRPGAGGTIGAAEVARSAPDGHTLLFVSNTHLISGSLYRSLPYDAVRGFTPIIEMGSAPNVVVVHPSVPARTLAELFAAARSKPGELSYASSGNGSTQHLLGAHLWSLAGVKLLHVPYKGSGPATNDLLAGRVQASVPGVNNVLQHIRSGKLLALAVTSPKRSRDLPDVPSVAESFPGYDGSLWMGLMGPAGMPKDLVARIHRDLSTALASEEVKRGFTGAGFDIDVKSPEQFAKMLAAEHERWARVIKETGAKVD